MIISVGVIKRNFINNISFPRERLCEDFYFKCLILKKTLLNKNIAILTLKNIYIRRKLTSQIFLTTPVVEPLKFLTNSYKNYSTTF